jgi:hypothetical protein
VVYLLDEDDDGKTNIIFNDSLVTRLKGSGFDNFRKPGRATLSLGRPGVLKLGDIGKIDVEPGKEYYVLLYTVPGRRQIIHRFRLMDRDHFENSYIRWF